MPKVTIKDVAAHAGVSTATVSRVVHGQGHISPEHSAAVQKAIHELHWQPNAAAQRLRGPATRTVGLILPNTSDPFFGSIAESIIQQCCSEGLNIITLVSNTGHSYDEILQFRRLAACHVDGVIFCSLQEPDLNAFQHYFAGIPVVVCSRHDLIPHCSHVYFNHQKGGYLATRHLIEMGHRKIALIVGNFGGAFSCAEDLEPYLENPVLAGPYSGVDKYIGARRALAEAGIPFDPDLLEFIDLGDAYRGGYLAMQRLLSRVANFDAVFCANDLTANGAICMLTEQKIQVPDQVSVIGYDDGIMATCTQPQLSTVVQDTRRLGVECSKCMKKLLDHEPAGNIELDVQLIIRQSSCRKMDA